MDALAKWATVLGAACVMSVIHMRAGAGELPLAVRIVACESRGEHWDHGHLNCNKHEPNGKKSCGIAQFQRPTFNWMRHKAGVDTLDYNDPLHQLGLLNWALAHRLGHHWSCYRLIESGKWHMTPRIEREIRANYWIKLVYGV